LSLRLEDTEAAVQQEQDDGRKAENARLTNREPEKPFQGMMVAIRDSLSDLASSNNGENGEDEDEHKTLQGQLSEDDEPSWVMGTITNSIQQHMVRFRQKQTNLDELTQPGWEDSAKSFCERDKRYGTFELRVPAVVHP
jgi:hypothetical protein